MKQKSKPVRRRLRATTRDARKSSLKRPPMAVKRKPAVAKAKVFDKIQSAKRESMKQYTVDGFDNFLSRIGLNNDNALSASTYVFNLITRNRVLLEAAYRGSWIVGAVVDSVAEDMTRAGIDITTSDDADLNVLEKNITRLQIWQSLCNLIKWGRLYGGGLGVMQIAGQDMATPLDVETVGKDQFLGIVVFDRWQLTPVLTPVIQCGPDMGLPQYYQIVNDPRSTDPDYAGTATGQITVHHSRCIRYTGIDLPWFQAITEQMWGESNLERLWDRLVAFDNATMSSASLIDRANLRTVGINGFREILAAGGEAQAGLEAMFEMMRLLQVNEGLTLLDKEDTFSTTAYSFAGLSDMLLQFGQQIAGASGIPLVRLFGQSPAGLNATGEGDIRMYYDNINTQQENKLRRPMSPLIKVLWRSTFGVPTPDDLDFSFTPLWQMSAADKATNAKTNTETILAAHEGGLVDAPTSMKELKAISGDTGLFTNITEEQIKEAELEPPPLPDQADPLSVLDPKQIAPPAKKEDPPQDIVKNFDHKKPAVKWVDRVREQFNARARDRMPALPKSFSDTVQAALSARGQKLLGWAENALRNRRKQARVAG